MINAKMLGLLIAAFVAGSFVASPELRAYAANTIGSADIIDNSIQSVDVKDAQIKTADLAGNAVTSGKLKDGEVKTSDLANGAVARAKLGSDVLDSLTVTKRFGNHVAVPSNASLEATVSCQSEEILT